MLQSPGQVTRNVPRLSAIVCVSSVPHAACFGDTFPLFPEGPRDLSPEGRHPRPQALSGQ